MGIRWSERFPKQITVGLKLSIESGKPTRYRAWLTLNVCAKIMKKITIATVSVILCLYGPALSQGDIFDLFDLFEFKDTLRQGIKDKNVKLILSLFLIDPKGYNGNFHESYEKQIEYLLKQDVFDIEILELTKEDEKQMREELPAWGIYSYTAEPSKKIMIRYRRDDKGWAGTTYFIGIYEEKWRILTLTKKKS